MQFLLNEDASIIIGKDCMFSAAIKVWGSDGHSIINLDSGNVVNKSAGIRIGNHVWVCENARILKNSIISDNSVVANSAVVTGKFLDNNIVIGENPGKIIKTNINWNRDRPE